MANNAEVLPGKVPSNPVRITDDTGVSYNASNPLPVSASVAPAANQRVNAQSGDFVAGAIADLATLLTLAGATTDANTVNSLMGRLTKIRDLLNATLAVSGSVTANVGTTNGLALDASINGVMVAQGSTTSGEKGPMVQGAVTTSAPSYTTAQTSPLSLTPAGALRTDASATTQPVSAASLPLPSGASTSAKQPALGTAGAASSDVLSVQGIASMTALKVDGSGVTQPVSGTVTANAGTGNFTVAQATGSNLHTVLDAGSALIGTIEIADSGGTNKLAIDSSGRITLIPNSSVNVAQVGAASYALGAATVANSQPTTNAAVQGWIAATGTGTASQDDTLTFANQVRKVVLYNASANAVPFEFDATSAATSFPIQPGQYMVFDDVLCTTIHVFPSATLTINTTSGLYVKGWK